MCDYCGCQDVGPIGELSREHEAIEDLAAALRRRLEAGQDGTSELVALQDALGIHLQREEVGLFAELTRLGECTAYLGRLADDHARARASLLSARQAGSAEAPLLLAGLAELAAHIETEEHDFFPASRLLLDETAWSTVAAAHRRLDEAAAPVG